MPLVPGDVRIGMKCSSLKEKYKNLEDSGTVMLGRSRRSNCSVLVGPPPRLGRRLKLQVQTPQHSEGRGSALCLSEAEGTRRPQANAGDTPCLGRQRDENLEVICCPSRRRGFVSDPRQQGLQRIENRGASDGRKCD